MTRTISTTMAGAVAGMAIFFMTGTADAQRPGTFISSGDTTIAAAPGGGYRITRDGGRTWAPYNVRPAAPPRLPAVAPGPQNCDIYQCGAKTYVVPQGTVGVPGNWRHVGTGVVRGQAVDPRTHLLR